MFWAPLAADEGAVRSVNTAALVSRSALCFPPAEYEEGVEDVGVFCSVVGVAGWHAYEIGCVGLHQVLQCLADGKKERHRDALKTHEAVMFVEGRCALVLGINENRVGANSGCVGSFDCIVEHDASKLVATILLIDGQATDAHRGDCWIARQALGDFLWQFIDGHACGRQCVIRYDTSARLVYRHIAGREVSADILAHATMKIVVERVLAAVEHPAIMFVESFNAELV